MQIHNLFIAAVVLASVGIGQAQDNDLTATAKARAAVERSLPFLEREGTTWMKEKNCASCHAVPFLLWSHNEARAHGITVDEKKLSDWTEWTWTFSRTRRAWFKLTKESLEKSTDDAPPREVLAKLTGMVDKSFDTEKQFLAALGQALTPDELDQYQAALVKRAARPPEPDNDGGGLDTLSQLLLGRASDAKDRNAAAFLADMRDLMLRWQQPDGSWKAAGQLPSQNRPHAETNEVTTMWAVLALASLDQRDPSTDSAIKRAADFLSNVKPGKSNESLVVALLVQRTLGHAHRAADLLAQLLSRQNPDGGWAWLAGGDSDAFATGQVLYGLTHCDLSADDAAVQRARDYLVESQTADGSWSVPGRAISSASTDARLKKVAPIYRYWGTGWAVIGLSRTLPQSQAIPAAQKPER